MVNELKKRYQVEKERNKYELKHEIQEKEIIKKNLDSISNPFEREYFKVKKIDIIEKMIGKSQQSGSSGHSDDCFSNCNEYDGENYEGDLPPY